MGATNLSHCGCSQEWRGLLPPDAPVRPQEARDALGGRVPPVVGLPGPQPGRADPRQPHPATHCPKPPTRVAQAGAGSNLLTLARLQEPVTEPSARPGLQASHGAGPSVAAASGPWAAGNVQWAAARCARQHVAPRLLPSKNRLPAKHRVPLSETWNSNSYTESRQSWLHRSAAPDQTQKAFVI